MPFGHPLEAAGRNEVCSPTATGFALIHVPVGIGSVTPAGAATITRAKARREAMTAAATRSGGVDCCLAERRDRHSVTPCSLSSTLRISLPLVVAGSSTIPFGSTYERHRDVRSAPGAPGESPGSVSGGTVAEVQEHVPLSQDGNEVMDPRTLRD